MTRSSSRSRPDASSKDATRLSTTTSSPGRSWGLPQRMHGRSTSASEAAKST
ncbi:MAG: hypothetical protein MZU91_13415 [Desulfosudis oleivorans]|nr:hypothetical protein [Desulfosudis oleivorans]